MQVRNKFLMYWNWWQRATTHAYLALLPSLTKANKKN